MDRLFLPVLMFFCVSFVPVLSIDEDVATPVDAVVVAATVVLFAVFVAAVSEDGRIVTGRDE